MHTMYVVISHEFHIELVNHLNETENLGVMIGVIQSCSHLPNLGFQHEALTHWFLACFQLAPMSTTTDIATAAAYSISRESVIFKIVTKNKLQRGADLRWVSAFPAEAEILYPPLTYLQPTGRTRVIEVDAHHFTIVEVTPTLA
jgi:hypothetical protein